MKRKLLIPGLLIVLALILSLPGYAETPAYWAENTPALHSLQAWTAQITDQTSDSFLPEEDRIAVFDFDGTLFGERFPTYFDTCLFLHRVLHDETYSAEQDVRTYAEALELSLFNHEPEPDSPRSTAQMAAETFRGFSVEDYAAYIRSFARTPAPGFSGMTYGEGFFLPMISLVSWLEDQGFTVFISSGSERTLVRQLIRDTPLGELVSSDRIIGSSFSLMATGQGDKAGRSYTFKADDAVLLEGNLVTKNQKTNKVFSIVDEIGKSPVLVFGNSSGDLAMAQYALQHGGKAYMLLCDDITRDYGDPDTAAAFALECEKIGCEIISMRDDFTTIYGEDVFLTEEEQLIPAA